MNSDHEEQTRWLVDYLEARFSRIEDRLDRAIDKVDQAILAQSDSLEGLKEKVNQVENEQLKLSNQAGFLKNLLAFGGTIVLSLIGWAASYLFQNPK